MKVSLGNKPEDACTLNYALPPTVKGSASAFTAVEGECVR
ncbi:hypothetical protein SAMN05216345_1201 [Cupriavidus sp. YR651]|nr:hypothetical protein SAMN05216345_1201 [Cupriavidus sp. YR651]